MLVVILMAGRTGSSMVAKMFNLHGFETHSGKNKTSLGYPVYEHGWLRPFLKPLYLGAGVFVAPNTVATKIIGGRVSGDYCIKTGVEYWPLLEPLKPAVILVKRNVFSAVESMHCKRGGTHGEHYKNYKARLDLMNSIDGQWIDTDEIIARDYSSVLEAFAYYKIPLNYTVMKSAVERDRWHH